jgi:hypothetical protein
MRYSVNIAFQIKMVLILLAGLNAAYYHQRLMPMLVFNEIGPTPINVRVIGVISLSIWFTVLALGRLIPYLGTG